MLTKKLLKSLVRLKNIISKNKNNKENKMKEYIYMLMAIGLAKPKLANVLIQTGCRGNNQCLAKSHYFDHKVGNKPVEKMNWA